MAENKVDPFEDIGSAQADMPPEVAAREQIRFKGISDWDRFILNNLFDTQPAKRKAYAAKIGIELNPEDDNEFRIAGTDADFDGQIDPGVSSWFKKGGLKELANDVRDIGYDVAVAGPLQTVGALGGAGLATAAGQAGPQALAPEEIATVPIAAIIGGVLGGAYGNFAAEELKNGLGQMVLETPVAQDRGAELLQSLVAGMAPVFVKGGTNIAKGAIKEAMEMRTKALKNLIAKVGGIPNKSVLDKAMKTPEKFEENAVKGAREALSQTYRTIFGKSDDELLKEQVTRYIPEGSVFSPKYKQLGQDQAAELAALDKNKAANWTVEEVVAPLKSQLAMLSSGEAKLTADQKAARRYLIEKIDEIYRDAASRTGQRIDDLVEEVKVPKFKAVEGTSRQITGKKAYTALPDDVVEKDGSLFRKFKDPYTGSERTRPLTPEEASAFKAETPTFSGETTPGSYDIAGYETIKVVRRGDRSKLDRVELPFSTGNRYLQVMQDDAHNIEVPGNRYLKQAISTLGDRGLGVLRDKKASSVGSALPRINDDIEKVLNTYNNAKRAISPDNIANAFIGADVNNAAKTDARMALAQVDEVLGTDLSSDVGMKNLQAWAEKVYENGSQFGSGRVRPAMAEGFVKGAVRGGAMGAPGFALGPTVGKVTTAAGALAGGARGAIEAGAMASPETALRTLGRYATQEQAARAALPINEAAILRQSQQAVQGNLPLQDVIARGGSFAEAVRSMPIQQALKQKVTPPVSPSIDESERQRLEDDPFGDF